MSLVVTVLTVCVLAGLLVLLMAGGLALHDAASRLSPRHEEPDHVPPHGVLGSSARHHRMASRFERVEDLTLVWRREQPAAPQASMGERDGSDDQRLDDQRLVDLRDRVTGAEAAASGARSSRR